MALEDERKRMYKDFGLSYPEGGLKQPKSGQQQIADFFGGLWNDFTGKTNNQMNLDFQRENLDYQKALQKDIFSREDTAYQRTVSDMRAAGLNPLSMNGTNGAGEAIATEPMESQKTSDLQAMSQILDVVNMLSNMRSNASVSQAQSSLINAQADNQRIKNLWESDILAENLENLRFDTIGKQFKNELSNLDLLNGNLNMMFNTAFGLTDNMPESVKMALLTTGNNAYSSKTHKFNRDWNTFGRTFTYWDDNKTPSFDLDSGKLQGAVIENILGNALLGLLNNIRIPLGGK